MILVRCVWKRLERFVLNYVRGILSCHSNKMFFWGVMKIAVLQLPSKLKLWLTSLTSYSIRAIAVNPNCVGAVLLAKKTVVSHSSWAFTFIFNKNSWKLDNLCTIDYKPLIFCTILFSFSLRLLLTCLLNWVYAFNGINILCLLCIIHRSQN